MKLMADEFSLKLLVLVFDLAKEEALERLPAELPPQDQVHLNMN